jgi:hypothetical protein
MASNQAVTERERLVGFAALLHSMTPRERRAAAKDFTRRELLFWARLYPEEVPILEGEYAWITLTLADNEPD